MNKSELTCKNGALDELHQFVYFYQEIHSHLQITADESEVKD